MWPDLVKRGYREEFCLSEREREAGRQAGRDTESIIIGTLHLESKVNGGGPLGGFHGCEIQLIGSVRIQYRQEHVFSVFRTPY